ncbi:hypothetical protein E2C01_011757 [Portunus trituberculatus]|uniref:Uncharacterized protein n=1 Tax=Portunus trituberculatus TaxID=210409 RepID=A0A5B7DC46_PORTR|nr:hypothetical protein [Portunus trituberculatus]
MVVVVSGQVGLVEVNRWVDLSGAGLYYRVQPCSSAAWARVGLGGGERKGGDGRGQRRGTSGEVTGF